MTDDTPAPAEYSPGYLRYALGLLTAVYTFNFIDRQILVILQESIKQEMGLSDAALGLLSGFTFAIFYVTAGLPIARIADRGVRRNVIAVSVAVWSLMTAISGLAQTFWQLLAARIGVGLGEAGGSPPAHAIISDYFPFEQRGRALSIFHTGIYLGILTGFLAGGWINQYFGWRMAFFVVGLPGLFIALLVRLTIREPRRGHSDGAVVAAPQPPLWSTITQIWQLSSFRWMALATGFTAFVTYGAGNFAPSLLARSFHLEPRDIGMVMALTVGVGGMCGTYLGGTLADRLGRRDRRWYLWMPAASLALSLPLRLVAYHSTDIRVFLAVGFVAEVLGATWLPPVVAMSHGIVPPALRALVSSVLYFVLNLIGLGLGPLTTGLLSDRLSGQLGTESLRWAIMLVCLANIPAVGCYLAAARGLRRDLAQHAH
ncbi:MAG: MFS transporter [Gemmatimonadota bacterium]|nr:MFS transporter [Gemmatimonadota bacterium]